MKRLLGILALIFVFASSAYATDVTVGASTIPNFNPSNAGSDRTLTVTVNNGSNIVSCSACMPSNTVGLSGFRVNINGTQYVVQSVSTQSLFVLTTLYAGAGGSTSMTLYKYVLFRIYADRAFQPKNKTYIVQPGVPGSSSWYKQVGASIISDGATSSLYLSEMILDATTDAVSPTNQAKYTAAFYRTDNSLVQYYNCFEQFALPATTPTTWTAICTYNSPTAIVPPNRDSYTKSEIDNRFASCSSGQLYYFASSGNVVSCLTLGTNLSITSGVLNATGGGGGNVRQALNLVADYSCDNTGVVAADTCLANAVTAATASTGKIIYAPAGVYKLTGTATIPGGVTIEGDGRDKTIFSGTVASAPILDLVRGSGAYLYKGPTIRHLEVMGNGASGQIGIRATDATYVYGVVIEDVAITSTGSDGLYIGKAFSSRFINIISGSSVTGYPFHIYADSMPGNYYEGLYAGDVNATSPAGFRIQRGNVYCVACNGINASSANSWWAIVGDKIGVDGAVSARGAYFHCTDCNVESSKAGGILSYSNSPIDLDGATTFGGDGAGSGSYVAIKYDIDLVLNPYPAFNSEGKIGPKVSFQNTPIAFYANSEPIHATDVPPLVVEGQGPDIAGQNGYGATFYNDTTGRSEKLRRVDAAAPFTTITTSTVFTQPGPRYFETNCASNCTLTLPWSGWYPNGEYVTIRNLSADGIVVTIASGGGGSVNGGTYALAKSGQSITLYANNVASDWRIVSSRGANVPNTYVAVGDTTGTPAGTNALTWDLTTLTATKAGGNPSLQIIDSTNLITTRFGPLASAPDRGIAGTSTDHPFVFYQNGNEAWGIDTNKYFKPYAGSNTVDLGTSAASVRTGYFGTSLLVGTASGTTGTLTFYNSTNGNTFTIKPGVTGANLTYTLPTAYSSGTQCLADNGSGTLSWAACSGGGGGGSPGGSDTYVQFNDGGSFGGSSGFTYNKTTKVVSAAHEVITQSDTTIVPLIVKAVGASTAELLQIKDSAGNVRGGYATSGAGFYRGFSSAPTAALANDGKLFYDITGGVTNQQLVLSKNTGQYNPIVVANQASYTANKIPLWSSTSWELENSMMTQGAGAVSLTIAPTASSSGSPTILTLTGPAHTALAADTEATDVNLNLNRNVQFTAAGGTFSLQRAIRFQSPTYRATGSETIGTAVLLYLDTPKAGTNMTLTNSYALGISPSALGHHGLYFDFQTSATGNFIEFNSSGSSFGKIVSRTDRANYVFGGHTTSTADTDGFVYIPSVAGVPVGTPTAYTGTAPLTLDSTNNRLYGYMGGAWRNLTGAGGTPGGSNTQLQYNNAGSFGGITGATTNGTFVTLTTPVLGVASATSINKVTLTAPATGSTLTIADGKTLTASNTLTFTGTDASSVAFGTGGTVTYTANNLSVFAATTSAQLAGVLSNETGSGLVVFGTSPALTTPSITTGINDSNGNSSILLTPTVSAVNQLTVANAATAGAVTLSATGSDVNVSMNLVPKGSGTIQVGGVQVVTLSSTDTLTNKTLTTPTIGSFANAAHNHTNAAGGGQLTDAALSAAVTVAKGGTGLTAGTSGGIPYFSSTSTIASSAALTANAPVIGGGAGVAPTVGTRSGNTTTFTTASGTLTSGNCAQWDASGNIVAASGPCGVSGSGYGTIQEEGSNLTARTTMNFVGSGITAADDVPNTRTNITVDSDLNALASNSTNGLWTVTGAGTGSARTITGTTNVITVTNGDGVAGNPTLTVGSLVVRTDQGNTWTTGDQVFGISTTLTVPISAGAAPTISGRIAYDSTSDTLEFGSNTNNRIIATTSNNLSAFAATTSAQLAGVLSDETGSGSAVFGTAPTISGGTHTALTSLGIRSTGTGAFDLTLANTENLTLGRTLTLKVNDAARTVDLGGNLTLASSFTTSGANALTLTTSGATNVTLPTSGTLAVTGNPLSQFAATTSAQLAGVISDETGSGVAVFATSPTLTTPVLGVASATTINKVTLTAPATGSTLTIAEGKTLTASNTLTFTGTDASSVAFGTGGTVTYTANNLSVFAATTSAQLAGVLSDETGSGVAVFGTSPAITTSLTTGSSSFDLLNTTATTINFGGAATAINMAGGSGAVVKLGGGTLAAELRFMEPSGGAEYISFKAPSLASNLTYTWPTAFGSAGQCLSDNGSGTLSWVACSGGGGGTPGGSNKQIQFNNSSAFGGATGFEYQSGASPNVSITAQDISYTPLNVNGLTSQTAPIQTWQLNGANRTVIGEDARSIYIGNGRTSGTGTTGVVSGTEATGTNIGGSGLLLQGGAGTGTGTGGSVMFKTAPTGSSGSSLNAYVIAMEIDSKSNIELGSGLNTTSSTEGFVYVQSVAGLPTGVPGTSYSGTTPAVIDSTNKGFCMYVSGWNCVRPTGGTTSQLLYNNGGYAAGIAGAASNGTTVTFASASLLATSPAITTSLTTSSTTFALINTGATTVNFAGAATTLNMAGGSGAAINLGGGANAAELRFLEPSAGGSQYTAFKAGSQGSNITYTLPTTVAAVDGDVLSSNTSGTLSWITPTPATPPGTIVAYGGSTAPSGWLMCDGAAVSRTGANAALFAIVGTSYGAGNGTTTFNVPDLQQRFPMGKAVSGTGATLGNTGGSIDHTHTSAAHTHGATGLTTGGPSGTAFVPNGTDVFVGNDSHTHTISGSTASTTPGATGSNNPPYVVVNYIIKL